MGHTCSVRHAAGMSSHDADRPSCVPQRTLYPDVCPLRSASLLVTRWQVSSGTVSFLFFLTFEQARSDAR